MKQVRPISEILVALLVAGVAGCGGDALDLEPSPSDAGSTGGPDAGGSDALTGPGGEPIEIDIDRAVFRSVVLPILDRRCSTAACHAGPAPRDDQRLQLYGSPQNPVDRLTEEQVEANLREVVAFVDFLDPDASDLLRFPLSDASGQPPHSTPSPVFFPGSEEAAAIREWIVDATQGDTEPDAGVGPGPSGPDYQVPCGALPDPTAVRGPAWFESFAETAEPMLLETCTGADCHSVPGNGGGYWLRLDGTDCDRRWNFLVVQWYIDPVSPLDSRLLQKPLDPTHGGREVFHGTSDARFGLLKDWIISGVGR